MVNATALSASNSTSTLWLIITSIVATLTLGGTIIGLMFRASAAVQASADRIANLTIKVGEHIADSKDTHRALDNRLYWLETGRRHTDARSNNGHS